MHRSASLAAVLAAAALTTAAQPPDKIDAIPTFGTSTELVYVRFHVEKKGGYVDTLKPDQIRVLEDGRPQKIALLETPSTRERTIPPEVTLALDVSSSVMDERLIDESLVRDVLFASLGEQARVGLCAFGGELRCLRPPTRDAESLVEGFQEALRFGGETRREGTRLYASLAEICRKPKEGEKAQRAMIVFSDGLENRGGKVQEAIQAAAEGDVRVYSILLSQAFQTSSRNAAFGRGVPNRTMYDYKKFELSRLAEESGGRAFEPGTVDPKSLAKILRTIATEISMENVVGYEPEGAATGQKRHVKVELADKSVGSIKDGERTLVR